MATTAIKLTLKYEDETKRDITLSPFSPTAAAVTGAKSNIISFNTNDLANVEELLLSDTGAKCTGIVEAHVTTTDEKEYNLND